MSKTIVKTRENGSRRIMIKLDNEVVTEQHSAKDVDVNQIVKKAKRTGFLRQATGLASYGDFTGISDFHEAQNRLIQADQDFMKVPAEIRERFHNDPGELIEFINDPNNLEEARTLGLVPKLVPKVPKQPEAQKGSQTESESLQKEDKKESGGK